MRPSRLTADDRSAVDLASLLDRANEAGNVAAHVAALTRMSRHDVRPFNPVDRPDAAALLDLNEFDVVVIHYRIAVTIERYLPNVLREKIARFQGLKVQFIQDEYRWIDAVTARVRELEIDLLYTLIPEAEVAKIYGSRLPEVKITTTLASFVPDELVDRVTLPLAGRPIDVGLPRAHGSVLARTFGVREVGHRRGVRRERRAFWPQV